MNSTTVTVGNGNGVNGFNTSGGVGTTSRNGRGVTAVTIKDDIIVATGGTKLASGTSPATNMQWYLTDSGTHANAAQATYPFTGQTLYYIRAVNPATNNFLQRASSDSTATAPINTGASPGTAAQGQFAIPAPDPVTGITSASLFSYNDANNAYMFGLLGNAAGFVAEGTNLLGGSSQLLTAQQVRDNAPIMFYEQVTDVMLPPDFFN